MTWTGETSLFAFIFLRGNLRSDECFTKLHSRCGQKRHPSRKVCDFNQNWSRWIVLKLPSIRFRYFCVTRCRTDRFRFADMWRHVYWYARTNIWRDLLPLSPALKMAGGRFFPKLSEFLLGSVVYSQRRLQSEHFLPWETLHTNRGLGILPKTLSLDCHWSSEGETIVKAGTTIRVVSMCLYTKTFARLRRKDTEHVAFHWIVKQRV